LLDTFEVTVGRFRAFVENYPFDVPSGGAGANPNDSTDPGWDSRWLENVDWVPQDKAKLIQTMTNCGGTYGDPTADDLPINCVNWFVAFAFCVWDGGRLPTEAEWNYAGAGGAEDRVYPWSVPWYDDSIDAEHARYGAAGPQPVGAATQGESRWGQFDLAGNLAEWTADAYQYDYGYPAINCLDCVDSRWELPARVTRGGSFQFDGDSVAVKYRGSAGARLPSPRIGFRCVRNQ
jgi:formylglycine-generating enzyme required for sulfatase activity